MPAFPALAPSQILQLNCPAPTVAHTNADWDLSPAEKQQYTAMMGRDMFHLFLYNKTQEDRICPQCRTRYRPLPEAEAVTRQHKEQLLSGICSANCFRALNGPSGFSPEEWLGVGAESVRIHAP